MEDFSKRLLAIVIAFALLVIGAQVVRGLDQAFGAAPSSKEGKAAGQSDSERVKGFWERAQEGQYKSPDELRAQDAREAREGIVYAKLIQGNPRIKAVALTFDDGPHPQYTPQILAILKKYDIRATFFVVGKMAEAYPDLVKMEAEQGNVIGNHTYDHVNLTKIPTNKIYYEWEKCDAVVRSIIGRVPTFCRPPGGDYDGDVIKEARSLGMTTVLWTDDPGDYASPGDKVIEKKVFRRVGNGGIILIHDGIQQTIDVLPQIIETLKKRGFRFVTVDEMMREKEGSALRRSVPVP